MVTRSTVPAELPLRRTASHRLARHRLTRRRVQEWGAAYTLLVPALILLAIWFVYPIVQSFLLSFQDVSEFDFDRRSFTGLSNYSQLFGDGAFQNSLRITLIFVVVVVPVQTVVSLGLAAVLKSASAARAVFRVAFFLPYMISTVAVTTVFKQLFVQNGPITGAAHALGAPDTTWYADVHLALPFLVIVYVYMYIGLYVVTFVGGMEAIPPELYEAARVDGANAWVQFRRITVPSLRPFTAFVVVAGMIQAVQIFDQAYVVSGGTVLGSPAGATSTLVVFIYQQAFRLNELGYGAAAAVVLLAVVLVGTVITRRLVPEESS